MRFHKIILLFLSAVVCLGQAPAQSQDDPLSELRKYPPHMLSRGGTDIALSSIKWQLEQLHSQLDQSKEGMDRLEQQGDEQLAEVRNLTNNLPVEIRFVDDAVRSRLVGKAMEELLGARLDVATQEKAVSLLEEQLKTTARSEVRRLQAAEHELQSRSAKAKLSLANEQYEQARKLMDKGMVTSSELGRSKLTLETAKFEVEAAELRRHIASREKDTEIAQKLTEARIEVEPIKARIEAAEAFLRLFSDSAETNSSIEQLMRNIETLRENQQDARRENRQLERTINELRVLSGKVQISVAKMDKEKAGRPEMSRDPKK